MSILLKVENLKTYFHTDSGLLKAVDGISYHINEQEVIGLVGESGCGKSVSQLSVMQLLPPAGQIIDGKVIFEGQNLLTLKPNGAEICLIRGGKIAMIFQEPMTSLNPVLTISQHLESMLELHLKMDRQKARKRSVDLLNLVGIPDANSRIDDYPHQFSGGMRQRVMIALALSCNPKLIIADEPTTAVDVTIQAQLLELMNDMVTNFKTSLILVTHNLGVVARYAKRIYVMYAGRIIESGTSKEIFSHPRHPYTIGLLKCIPRLDDPQHKKLVPIEGLPPYMINVPPTCAFLSRCSYRTIKCEQEPWPELKPIGGQQYVSCYVDTKAQVGFVPAQEVVHVQAKRIDNLSKDNPLVEVRDLKMYFPVIRGILRRTVANVKAVDGISYKIGKGETMGLVGESGCGKTTTGRCILRLYQPTAGQVFFEGQDISQMPESKIRPFRRRMSLIFQDPFGSLDPRQSAGSIIGEPLIIHHLVQNKGEYKDRVEELFRIVGLDPAMMNRVPHEFSGGQRQRIGIACALACDPSLIVCDEPVSALDVSIQAQIINLLEELREGKRGLTYLFIAHDLSVVRHISKRLAVMYLGRIVEITDSESLYDNPLHPYTKALLSAVPIPDSYVEEQRKRIILKGEVPSPLNPPSGCHFHERCSIATQECSQVVPQLHDVGGDHQVACIRI